MAISLLEQSEAEVPPGDDWLGGTERVLLARLKIPKRRADWRLGRWTAKRAIARYLGRGENPGQLAAIEVLPAFSGAPEAFIDGQPARLSLSLSHSSGVGFCAVADERASVGCDVEKIVPRSSGFITDYFTESEQIFVQTTSAADRDIAVTLLWSCKESVLKLLRCGLRSSTCTVSVSPFHSHLCRTGVWSVVDAHIDIGQNLRGWWKASSGFVWTIFANGCLTFRAPWSAHCIRTTAPE